MQIPPFSLPSNPAATIYLREATVADCEQFADTDARHDERLSTLVLRTLQSSPEHYSDPLDWTASDRQLAAFWYHAHTTNDPSIHLPYSCPHCGQEHDALVKLTDIAALYAPMQGLAYRRIEHEGEEYEVRPLDGHAMEELEELRAGLPESSDSHDYRRLTAVIKRHELVASLAGLNETRVRDVRIADIERKVRAMTQRSATELHRKVQDAQASMAHGLPSIIVEGETLIVTPPIACDKEAGRTTRLRFPFFWSDYLPRLW
ncbi:hypothetical protein [Vreelandella alkaliphila]|uniref:Morphogenetic protein n=1 Tax=Vreelandella alkaliphila TaxID=272774 RepID=A0AAJ2RXB7_9GAMM|nr:hypothetical protein [Halomonas alkaliphila]MDX5979652.1 hypothetical protein [Halomonas alkaliphila]